MDLASLIRNKRPEIKDSSIALYVSCINKLHDMKEYKTLRLLYKTEAVLSKLESFNLAQTTYKNYIQAMAVALDALPKQTKRSKDTIKIYRKIMFDKEKARQKFVDTHSKSEKEKKNWVTLEYLKQKAEEYKKIYEEKPNATWRHTAGKNIALMNYIVSLFYSNPPVLPRLEIANLRVLTPFYLMKGPDNPNPITEEDLKKMNYLIIHPAVGGFPREIKMTINDDKTTKHTGPRTTTLPDIFYEPIWYLYKEFREHQWGAKGYVGTGLSEPPLIGPPFMFHPRVGWGTYAKGMTNNAFGKWVGRIFEDHENKRKPTATTIRHIIISSEVDLEQEEKLDALAKGAGHSRKQQVQYAKKQEP